MLKLGSINYTLPQVPKKELLKLPGVYEAKRIDIHEDFERKYEDGSSSLKNDLAILTLAKPFMFDNNTKKGELQTKSYHAKGRVE